MGGETHRYRGTILAIGEDDNITVLLDRIATNEYLTEVEDLDDTLGGLPDNVPPIQGMVR